MTVYVSLRDNMGSSSREEGSSYALWEQVIEKEMDQTEHTHMIP